MTRSLRQLLEHEEVREVAAIRGPLGLMALHGGIEPPTFRIARKVADSVGATQNAVVQPGYRDKEGHLTSTLYHRAESPALDAFLGRVRVVLSVHGMNRRDMNDQVALGGSNRPFATRLGRAMRMVGLEVVDDLDLIPRYLRGAHRDNPVNIPPHGGVQIEIGRNLRRDAGKIGDLTEAMTEAARTQLAGPAIPGNGQAGT